MKLSATSVIWSIILVLILSVLFGCQSKPIEVTYEESSRIEPERVIIYPAVFIHKAICKTSDNYLLTIDVTVQFPQDKQRIGKMVIIGKEHKKIQKDIEDICRIFIGEIPKENLAEMLPKLRSVMQFLLSQKHKKACQISLFYTVYNTPIQLNKQDRNGVETDTSLLPPENT